MQRIRRLTRAVLSRGPRELFLGVAAGLGLVLASALAAPAGPVPTVSWVTVVDDRFASLTALPAHWRAYDGPYGSAPGNCATPSHDVVANGALHLLMAYDVAGTCGAGWYTGGLQLDPALASVEQRVTVTFRVVDSGVTGHYIVPMRWPTTAPWPAGGEEDFCESDPDLGACATFLHYGTTPTTQVSHPFGFDPAAWHTIRAERVGNTVTIWIDDMTKPVWSYVGDATTLPDTVKTVVLQQECPRTGCPDGIAGSEDIQVASVHVEEPLP